MDSLFENPIARMFGPEFLILYGLLFVFAFWFIKNKAANIVGKINENNDLKIPLQPDPYEIAYIRAGEREVLTLIIYNLIKRNYFSLMTNKEKKNIALRKQKTEADINGLSIIERTVYNNLKEETYLKDFILKAESNPDFENQCNSLKKHLEGDHMIWTAKEFTKFSKLKRGILIFLTLIGIYKLIAAILHGHANVVFLLVEIVIGNILINDINFQNHKTSKGEKMLENFKSTFKPIFGDQLLAQPFFIQQLQLGIYGFILLSESQYNYLYKYLETQLKPIKTSNWDWNTSSSSGSSSGSGGCGGSCGGGCGGGCGGCS